LLASPRGLINRIRSAKSVEQLKARHFEINGSGGFQLSYYVEGLERHYEIGTEIGVYLDPDDLIQKVALYLADEPLRESISEAGYARTMMDHTFENRFRHVFYRMGLQHV
jgi:spore maturation protein CgeB